MTARRSLSMEDYMIRTITKKCPECVKLGQKSSISIGLQATTLMGWSEGYDEDGNYYRHDPNITSIEYQCSKGHRWTEKQ